MQQPKEKPEPGAPPHVISIERSGWRVVHRPPGGPTAVSCSSTEKAEATRIAVDTAQTLADTLGETVQLNIQDAKGRPSATRYFDPTRSPKPKKGE